MSKNIVIRRADETDLPEIMDIYRDSILGQGSAFYEPEIVEAWARTRSEERFRDDAQNRDQIFFLAVDKDTGAATGFSAWRMEEDRPFLAELFVRTEAAGKGVGSTLLKAVEDDIRQHGANMVHSSGSLNAEKFYRNHGYEILDYYTRPLVSAPHLNIRGFVMQKKLI
jgi:GNAT superfamily N-acetyltransferase